MEKTDLLSLGWFQGRLALREVVQNPELYPSHVASEQFSVGHAEHALDEFFGCMGEQLEPREVALRVSSGAFIWDRQNFE